MIFRSSRSDDVSEGRHVFVSTEDRGYCNIPTGGQWQEEHCLTEAVNIWNLNKAFM